LQRKLGAAIYNHFVVKTSTNGMIRNKMSMQKNLISGFKRLLQPLGNCANFMNGLNNFLTSFPGTEEYA